MGLCLWYISQYVYYWYIGRTNFGVWIFILLLCWNCLLGLSFLMEVLRAVVEEATFFHPLTLWQFHTYVKWILLENTFRCPLLSSSFKSRMLFIKVFFFTLQISYMCTMCVCTIESYPFLISLFQLLCTWTLPLLLHTSSSLKKLPSKFS